VALPKEDEETDPTFFHHDSAELPQSGEKGVRRRLIAGEAYGARSPVRTHSPLFYVHSALGAGAREQLPNDVSERAAYVIEGEVEVGGQRFNGGQLLVFAKDAPAVVTALTTASLMLLGGEPVGERYIEWNFVSSSKERIEQAKADWRAGRMKLPDLDHEEFIPLPG
jgi:redox-sensitive bicupin YhaK (pirin superfamily)